MREFCLEKYIGLAQAINAFKSLSLQMEERPVAMTLF